MEFGNPAAFSVLSSVILFVYLLMLGGSIYAFVLFVKLARRGIRALDLFIAEKSNSNKEI